MNADDWARLRSHFERLAECPPAERDAALDQLDEAPELLGRLRRMLDADAGSGPALAESVDGQAPRLHAGLGAAGDGVRIGESLGPWKILGELGSGGMGRVYRARRDDGRYQAEVAIKVVAQGVDAARFLHERAVLARLQHPGIARLLDGGECRDGRPWLAMEYVAGDSIDRYLRSAGASPRLAVRLVRDSARAASYAHARAVLHRDLKPDNVLVDGEGRVKLLDFGVAKLLDDESDPGLTLARWFTPRYAAPEQLAGEPVTTATDVFALGIVLYELLSGRHPYGDAGGDAGASRRLLTGEPVPLRRALGSRPAGLAAAGTWLRDLEAVLGCALAREPGERYPAMADFADDLARLLDDRPVRARPPGGLERVRRWARRNRLAAAGLVLGLASLLAGAAIALWQADAARAQRDAALAEARRAERTADFLADIFRAANPAQARGAELSARDLLDASRGRLEDELGDDPSLRARLQAVLADTYRSLGDHDQAESLLRDALERGGGPRAPLLSGLGWVHAYQGRFEESAARLDEAVRAAIDEGLPDVQLAALHRRATPLINLDRLDEAEAAVEQAMALARAAPDAHADVLIGLHGMLANLAFSRGDLDRAERLYRESLEQRRRLHGPQHVGIGLELNNLATVAFRRGDLAGAEARYRESVAHARSAFGIDNDQVALPLQSLGVTLRRQGRGEEALATLAEAAQIVASWSGESHSRSLQARFELAELAWLLGRESLAREQLDRLDAAVQALSATGAYQCRLRLLRQLLAAAPDASERDAVAACLEQGPAPEAVRLLAGLARLHAGSAGSADREALAARLAALVPPDPPLAAAFASLP